MADGSTEMTDRMGKTLSGASGSRRGNCGLEVEGDDGVAAGDCTSDCWDAPAATVACCRPDVSAG